MVISSSERSHNNNKKYNSKSIEVAIAIYNYHNSRNCKFCRYQQRNNILDVIRIHSPQFHFGEEEQQRDKGIPDKIGRDSATDKKCEKSSIQ
ncbi:Hypothetical predicted protein [Octopus vulgaris]|uniref:Uncharacterized protein n=1 Tax=Octopus vulgaris TaxID=6645 RepID=A0AA36BL49_OCTVU|nr:Hypothetical predicted protein [Octopus vulgaris]